MDKAGLLQLPGRPEEQAWLRERLEVLTVREGIALDAAIQRHPAQDSTEVVSLLASLDEYEVLGGIQSYEDLGLYYLEETNARLLALRDYIDMDQLGRRYEKQHPGLFVGGCYVVYPEREQPEVYDGVTLPEPDYSWSLRLKLASSAVPEGVWLALPDYNDVTDAAPERSGWPWTLWVCRPSGSAPCWRPGAACRGSPAWRMHIGDGWRISSMTVRTWDLSSRNRTRGRRGSSRPISGYWSMSTVPPCPPPWIWRRI